MVVKNLFFESERLVARELSEDDVMNLYEIYSDSEAMKYRGSGPMKEVDDAQKMVAEQLLVDKTVSKTRLGLCAKSGNVLIGTVLFKIETSTPGVCEVGFSFGRNHWGNGYGTETLQGVMDMLEKSSAFDEIKAWCMKENTASNQIFRNAGFRCVEQNEYPESNLFLKSIN